MDGRIVETEVGGPGDSEEFFFVYVCGYSLVRLQIPEGRGVLLWSEEIWEWIDVFGLLVVWSTSSITRPKHI